MGRLVVKHPNGRPSLSVPTRGGRMHGEATEWYASGFVRSRGTYRDGKRHGEFEYYSEEGELERHQVFVDDEEVWRAENPDDEVPATVRALLERAAVREQSLADARQSSPPIFALADPQQGETTAIARSSIGVRSAERADAVSGRVSILGEWFPVPDWGAYARLISGTVQWMDGESKLGKGVFEVGGEWGRGIRSWRLMARAGVFAPVAGDDPGGYRVESTTRFTRAGDTALFFPHAAGLRGGLSLVRQRGPVFGRLDVGVDYVRDVAGDNEVPRIMADGLIARSAVSAGVLFGRTTTGIELSGVAGTPDGFDPVAAAALSVHMPAGRFQPFCALMAPLTGDDVLSALGVVVGVGYREVQ